MFLTAIAIILDFLLPFLVILGGFWIVRHIPMFVTGTRDLTLVGAVVTSSLLGVFLFIGWYVSDTDVNRVATWLGVDAPSSTTHDLNSVRLLLLAVMGYGFIWFNAVRSLIRRPFKLDNLFPLGYALIATLLLVRTLR
jgi:hypothetical protein